MMLRLFEKYEKKRKLSKIFLKSPQIFAKLCCEGRPIFSLSGLVVKYQANLIEFFHPQVSSP